MLDLLAASTTALFICAGFAVGARLLWLGLRTRGLPELTLGVGLFSIVGLGLPLQLAGLALAQSTSASALGEGLVTGSAAAMNVGWAAVWIFTWRVFRPESRVARGVVYAAFACLLALTAVAIQQRVGVASPDDPILVARTLATVLLAQGLYVWQTLESFGYGRRMRKRVALGLADPVVANRFMLWAMVGLFSFVSLLAPLGFTLAGLDYQQSAAGRLLTAVSGIGCALGLWLAFMPPRGYLRWVRGADAAAPTS